MRNTSTRLVSVMLSLPRNSHSLRIRMSTILLVWMSSAFVTITARTVGSPQEDVASRRERQREELRSFVLQLQSHNREESRDPEVQLGLAILHQRYGRHELSSHQRHKARFGRVLDLDPENKVVRAVHAKDATLHAIRWGSDLIDRLEGAIENAQQRGADKIYIFSGPPIGTSTVGNAQTGAWHNPLYEVIGDETRTKTIIHEKDYDQARAKVRLRFDERLKEAMDTLEQMEGQDPENALYNYLKANLYFELRQPGPAVKELLAAARKPSTKTYYEERQKAVTRALEAVDASSTVRSYIESFNPIGDYLKFWIWKPHVVPLARKSEEEGNLAEARQIYELSIGMAEHIREEPLPYISDYNRRAGRALDAWARERLSTLGERGN